MPYYAAFLRGVSPVVVTMAELKRAFEAAGFSAVRTVLSSGNVVFSARPAAAASLARRAEAAMTKELGRSFMTIVRPIDALLELIASDPYSSFRLRPGSKRIVTFLRERPSNRLAVPIELDGARILAMKDGEVFSAYVPGPKGAVFMRLIEKTLGKGVTTRTWETVTRVARRNR